MKTEWNVPHRLLAGLTALALLLMLALPVWAEGEETEKMPISINSVDDLLQLVKDCRLDSWSEGRTVDLNADLDLTGVDFAGIPSFSGTFDGNHHTISGLSLVDDGSVTGFFRYVQAGGVVHDLTVRGRSMPSGSRTTVGGIVGSNAGSLINCRFEGVSSGASIVGGIAGTNLDGGTINGCTTSGSVYGAHFIGGIVGQNSGVVINCGNDTSVNTTVNQNEVDLSELTLNDLIGTESATNITDIGGIAGTSSGIIRACLNRGTVGYQHIGYNIGGIVGSQTGYVEGCVNYGAVYARKEGGGIVGQMEPSSTLLYSQDTLQELADELDVLQTLVNRACDDASAASSDFSNQLTSLRDGVTSARKAIENLLDEAKNGYVIGTQTVKTDLTQFKQDLKDSADSIADGEDPDNPLDPDFSQGGDDDNNNPGGDNGGNSGSTTPDPGDGSDTGSGGSEGGETTPDPVTSEPAVEQPESAESNDFSESTDTQAYEADDTDRAVHGQPEPTTDTDDGIVAGLDPDNELDPGFSVDPSDDNNSSIADQITDALPSEKDILNGVSDALPNTVAVQIPSVELTNRDAITASRNNLSGNLTNIGDIINSLNSTSTNNVQALVNDIRAITAQMNKIGQTLSGASQNVTTDPDDVINDVSDEDTEDDVEAKVDNCVNNGSVSADINAGGITGAMARENDLDPEDDYTIDGSQSLNFTFKTRVVVRDSVNYGEVSAKKTCAGGIVGSMEMGSAIECYGLGTVSAEDASCVGGVAGSSKSVIRDSSAKCRISGAKQVGGIAGTGTTIENCRVMVVIDDATEQMGAVAGNVDDPLGGGVTGNTFVDEGCAGIDGVSYAGIAEPMSYEDFLQQEGLPAAFSTLTLRFMDEDTMVAQCTVPYGGSLADEDVPVVPAKEGSYGEWDTTDFTNITFDMTINAEYSQLVTARESGAERDGRAILLMEGSFTTTEALTLTESSDAPTAVGSYLESWTFDPEGDTSHTMRYLAPDGPDNVEVYLQTPDGWQKAETTVDGSYLKFTAPAGTTGLAAFRLPASKVPLIAACAGGAAALVLVLALLRKKRKARKAKKAAKKAEE